jgi:hypothetical protein
VRLAVEGACGTTRWHTRHTLRRQPTRHTRPQLQLRLFPRGVGQANGSTAGDERDRLRRTAGESHQRSRASSEAAAAGRCGVAARSRRDDIQPATFDTRSFESFPTVHVRVSAITDRTMSDPMCRGEMIPKPGFWCKRGVRVSFRNPLAKMRLIAGLMPVITPRLTGHNARQWSGIIGARWRKTEGLKPGTLVRVSKQRVVRFPRNSNGTLPRIACVNTCIFRW